MSTATVQTKWFEFRQNNSGGYFETDTIAGIGHVVMIEAIDSAHANSRAGSIGIEFGTGCPCCGSRWSSVLPSDGEDECVGFYGDAYRSFREGDISEKYLGEERLVFIHPVSGPFCRGAKVQP